MGFKTALLDMRARVGVGKCFEIPFFGVFAAKSTSPIAVDNIGLIKTARPPRPRRF